MNSKQPRTQQKPAAKTGPKTAPASHQRLSAQRAAAARERIAAAQRRRRLFTVIGGVAAVVLVAAVLVIVKVATGAGGPQSGKSATAASGTVLSKVATVPAATFDAIGTGSARIGPKSIDAPALTSGGKPLVLYVGAEYCPYCAAERWAVAVALSRFGALHDVSQTESSPSDVFPSTATLSFHDSTFSSPLLAFTARELQSNNIVNGSYAPLDKLSAAESAVVQKYNAPPYVAGKGGSIPFIDIGGKYVISGASYDPSVLQGKSHTQIAQALSDPTSGIAKGINGTANYISAALCTLTANKPAAVCTSPAVTAARAKLGSSR